MQIINGYRCQYEYSLTHPDAENVVFLNGILNKAQSWSHQIELIEKMQLNALSYDYRGQWYSQTTEEPYSLDLLADDLAALMDHVGIERAHLVGTSFGGFVSQKFALKYPQRVSSLYILTSSPIIAGRSRHIIENWCHFNQVGENTLYYDAMVSVIFSDAFFAEQAEAIKVRRDWFVDVLKILPDFAQGQYLLNKASLDDLDGDGLLDELHKIKCPTSVIAASNDYIYPPRLSKMIADRIDGAQYTEIEGSGHAVVLEKSTEVNQLLKAHLENCLARK